MAKGVIIVAMSDFRKTLYTSIVVDQVMDVGKAP